MTLLIGADLWPALADWAGIGLTWPREFYPGWRIALIAAIIGGARVLFNSFEKLLEGRLSADLALGVWTYCGGRCEHASPSHHVAAGRRSNCGCTGECDGLGPVGPGLPNASGRPGWSPGARIRA